MAGEARIKLAMETASLQKSIKDSITKLEQLSNKYQELNNKLKERGPEEYAKTLEKALESNSKAIDKQKNKLDELAQKYSKYQKQYEKALANNDTQGASLAKKNMDSIDTQDVEATNELLRLESEKDNIIRQTTSDYNNQTEAIKSQLNDTKQAFDSLNGIMEDDVKKVGKLSSVFSKVKATTKDIVSDVGSKLSNAFKSIFAKKDNGAMFKSVATNAKQMMMALLGARGAVTLISKAVSQIKEDNKELANTMDTLWNGLVQLIAPAVNMIVNAFATALNYIIKMASVVSGINILGKLKQTQKKKTGGSRSSNLYSFDTSETLNKSGSGGDSTTANYMKDVELNEKLLGYAEKLKSIWSDIQKIGKNIVDRVKEGFDYMDSGTRILDTLDKFVNSFLDHIKEMSEATVKWSESINFGPMFNGIANVLESIEPILENIGDLVVFIYTQAILPIATWITESYLPAWLESISSLLDVVNTILEQMQEPLQWIWDNVISPLASAIGNTIISILEQISEIADELGSWLTDHPEFVEFVTLAGGLVATLAALVVGFNLVVGVIGLFASALLNPIVVIGLIIAGIIALIAKFGDMNSATENMRTVFQGLLDFVQGVFTGDWDLAWTGIKEIFSGIWGLICNICDAALNAITEAFKVFGIDISGVVDGIKQILKGLGQFLSGVFTGNWKKAWEGIKNIFKGVWNSIVSMLESAVNWIVDGLNKISFSIPDWVPFGGGKTFGFNLSRVSLPKLAKGAVIPPNKEFLAMLGDQTRGRNIETPEGLLREIIQEESGAQEINIIASGDIAQLVKLLRFKIQEEDRRLGDSLIVGG